VIDHEEHTEKISSVEESAVSKFKFFELLRNSYSIRPIREHSGTVTVYTR
jgi:hypothetical protein